MRRSLAALVTVICLFGPNLQAAIRFNREIGWYDPDKIKRYSWEQYNFAMDAFKKGDYVLARKRFSLLIKKFVESRFCAQAQFMIAETYFLDGDYYRAYKAYVQLQENYPRSAPVEKISQRLFESGRRLCFGAKYRWFGLYSRRWFGLSVKSPTKGIECLEAMVRMDEWSDLADDALLVIGLSYLKRGHYAEAREAFERILAEHAESEHAARAQFLKAMASYLEYRGPAYDQTSAYLATRDLRVFNTEFPDVDDAMLERSGALLSEMRHRSAETEYGIAKYYLKNYKFAAALFYLRRVAEEYPETVYGQRAARAVAELADLQPHQEKAR